MPQDLIAVHVPLIIADPSPRNWTPLYDYLMRVCDDKTFVFMMLDDYMYMGEVGPVFLYKHSDTREYVNVDASGRLYEYRDGGYWPITPA